MGNIQQSEKVLKAKLNDTPDDLENMFNDAVKNVKEEDCIKYRSLFIKNLAKIILDSDIGVDHDFLCFCEKMEIVESHAKETKTNIEENEDSASNIDLKLQKEIEKALLIKYKKKEEEQKEYIKKEESFNPQNLVKQKEDNTFKNSNRALTFHMNSVRVFSTVGSNAMKATSNLSTVLAKTARFATNFSLIGITLTYISLGIFDDEGTKMKKLTEKMAKTLRKERDLRIYQQSMNDLYAQINSISKMFDKLESENILNRIDDKGIDNSEKTILLICLLQSCDVIYEKIIQKDCIYFTYAIVFLEFLYFFIRTHIDLLKLAVTKFSIKFYKDIFHLYVQNYKSIFFEYHKEAKFLRSDCLNKKTDESSLNSFSKIIANQYKIFETLVDNFNSEVLVSTEKTFTFNESVSGNVFANISTLYHEIDKFKPNFYEIDEILPKLKEEITVLLDERFKCILNSFNLYIERIENTKI